MSCIQIISKHCALYCIVSSNAPVSAPASAQSSVVMWCSSDFWCTDSWWQRNRKEQHPVAGYVANRLCTILRRFVDPPSMGTDGSSLHRGRDDRKLQNLVGVQASTHFPLSPLHTARKELSKLPREAVCSAVSSGVRGNCKLW